MYVASYIMPVKYLCCLEESQNWTLFDKSVFRDLFQMLTLYGESIQSDR